MGNSKLKEYSHSIDCPKTRVKQILEEAHDSPSREHFGINKTLEKIQKRFYWASCKQDVEEWCRSCKVYLARRSPTEKGKSPLQIYNVGAPFERVHTQIVFSDYFRLWYQGINIY